jgi:signal transduction histidine kinase
MAHLKKLFGLTTLGVLASAVLARSGVLASLFSANYLPHRHCYLAQPWLVGTNVASDGLIAISYAVIFSCLIWIARKLRDIPDIHTYLWVFFLFGLFIVACGATLLMEVVTVWRPIYPFSAAIKVVCIEASIPTAFLFAKTTPAWAKSIRRFLEMLVTTEHEIDQALSALSDPEALIAEGQRSAEELAAINEQWVLLYGNRKALAGLSDFRMGEDYWGCFPTPLFLCREVQIGQIITNLLNNAFDSIVQSYSAERWVSLGAEYSNREIHIDVTDSGPGVEDHFKAHLMEPFFATKELGLGMGVGLSPSRAAAQDHAGSLTLRPDTEHTCFRLILPIKGSDASNEEGLSSIGVPYRPA